LSLYTNPRSNNRRQIQTLLDEGEAQKAAVQNELEDLLMVLGDLEEKSTKYRVSIDFGRTPSRELYR
jgi:type II secretory pathway component PulM